MSDTGAPTVADNLRWLGQGGWVVIIEMAHTDRWIVSGKRGKYTLSAHGTSVEDAAENARLFAEQWEKEENARLAGGGK